MMEEKKKKENEFLFLKKKKLPSCWKCSHDTFTNSGQIKPTFAAMI